MIPNEGSREFVVIQKQRAAGGSRAHQPCTHARMQPQQYNGTHVSVGASATNASGMSSTNRLFRRSSTLWRDSSGGVVADTTQTLRGTYCKCFKLPSVSGIASVSLLLSNLRTLHQRQGVSRRTPGQLQSTQHMVRRCGHLREKRQLIDAVWQSTH